MVSTIQMIVLSIILSGYILKTVSIRSCRFGPLKKVQKEMRTQKQKLYKIRADIEIFASKSKSASMDLYWLHAENAANIGNGALDILKKYDSEESIDLKCLKKGTDEVFFAYDKFEVDLSECLNALPSNLRTTSLHKVMDDTFGEIDFDCPRTAEKKVQKLRKNVNQHISEQFHGFPDLNKAMNDCGQNALNLLSDSVSRTIHDTQKCVE